MWFGADSQKSIEMLRRTLRVVSPSVKYESQVASGKVRRDPRQVAALGLLDRLHVDLCKFKGSPADKPRDLTPRPAAMHATAQHSGWIKQQEVKQANERVGGGHAVWHPLSQIRGAYLWGGVGCGKTHLMDVAYDVAPFTRKRRVHFHQFMLECHKAMHEIKNGSTSGGVLGGDSKDAPSQLDSFARSALQTGQGRIGAPTGAHRGINDGNALMHALACRLCNDAELLCFDELVVADIADAMILNRLFHAMYRVGVVCIFTSNRAPDDLYKGGLNRESFVPFVNLLQDRCTVHHMDSDTDHRLAGTATDSYMYPLEEKRSRFQQLFLEMCKSRTPTARTMRVFGRDVVAPRTVGGVAHFHFSELCQTEMSVADYSVIAKTFHTVFLDGVPQFPASAGDVKRRFISLLDELYQYRVKLVVLAEVPPTLLEAAASGDHNPEAHLANEETFYAGQLMGSGEDSFQMERAISRLEEMRKEEYRQAKHLGEGVGLLDEAPPDVAAAIASGAAEPIGNEALAAAELLNSTRTHGNNTGDPSMAIPKKIDVTKLPWL